MDFVDFCGLLLSIQAGSQKTVAVFRCGGGLLVHIVCLHLSIGIMGNSTDQLPDCSNRAMDGVNSI
jgi:hypothetical protein